MLFADMDTVIYLYNITTGLYSRHIAILVWQCTFDAKIKENPRVSRPA